jgi:hypothetical protein
MTAMVLLEPSMAALTSGVCVAVALLVGLLLRIPFVSRWWWSTSLWAPLVARASLFVLTFGYYVGLTYVGTNPETGSRSSVLTQPTRQSDTSSSALS